MGDNVFAKWTDCRMYPARIVAMLPNSTYEVLFYDGFKKIVQPINVRIMPPDVQTEVRVAACRNVTFGEVPPPPFFFRDKLT